MFDDIQDRSRHQGMPRYHFSREFLPCAVHTHTHTLQWNAICQQIRGRDAGVIETAFTVNIQENMSAGEGRAAMVSQACEREAGYTLHH